LERSQKWIGVCETEYMVVLKDEFTIESDPEFLNFKGSHRNRLREKSHCRLDSTLASFLIPGIDFFTYNPSQNSGSGKKCVHADYWDKEDILKGTSHETPDFERVK
jgi:hypothetical protein